MVGKKRDPVTHVRFAAVLEAATAGGSPAAGRITLGAFFADLTQTIKAEWAAAADRYKFIDLSLVGHFPKVVGICTQLWRTLGANALAAGGGRQGAGTSGAGGAGTAQRPEMAALRGALVRFESAFLAQSLTRMFDPIERVFRRSARDPPSPDEIRVVVSTMAAELELTAVDGVLFRQVLRSVDKAVIRFANECERLVVHDPDAYQVGV